MKGVIVKSSYFSSKAVSHKSQFVKYLGTREGVVLNPELSEFEAQDKSRRETTGGYVEYIAKRPRVEKEVGREHGLFSYPGLDINLECVMDEVSFHNAPVWNNIISLTREDAFRLGYESIESWQNLLRRHVADMSKDFRISPDNLEWYAAFHNESHHPHVHMILFAKDGKQGRLTKRGIEHFRSSLTNDVFKNEMVMLYQKKTIERDNVKTAVRDALKDSTESIGRYIYDEPQIMMKLQILSEHLKNIKGKKQYGYLNKNVKKEIDEVVDELEKLPVIKDAYDLWLRYQDEIHGFYCDNQSERISLSKNPEFRSIKNMVIKEAIVLSISKSEDMLSELEQIKKSAEAGDAVCKTAYEDIVNRYMNDRADESIPLMVTRLAKCIENLINTQNEISVIVSTKPITDSKERQKTKEKKIAIGENPDDTESEENNKYQMVLM